MALIEVKNVIKTYVEKSGIKTQALRGVNLVIQRGGFVSIAGPSGSGKTTLLNLIGALDKPTRGEIYYEEKNIAPLPVNRLAEFRLNDIGFVFQAYNLINTLTALENVEYVMLLQNRDFHERKKKALELLKRVGLANLANKRPSQMSGGQQQRVAVARALASEPKVVLADEPTANLDSVTAVDLLDLMRELNREKGVCFIFSTHDKTVMEKADKIFYIKDGVIVS